MTERNQREKWWTAATISGTWCSHMKSNVDKYERDTPDFNPIGWAPVSGERATEVILIFIFKYFSSPSQADRSLRVTVYSFHCPYCMLLRACSTQS